MKLFTPILFLLVLNSNLFAQVATDSNKVDLHVNVLPGETYRYSTSTRQNMVQEIMGGTMEINQEFAAEYNYLIESVGEKSIKIKATVEKMQLHIDAPDEQIEFDSEQEGSDARFSKLNDLIGKSFYIFMNTDGKVFKVSGFEELSKDLKLGTFVTQLLTDSSLLNSLNMDIYPGQPVEMGESWNKTNSIDVANLKLQSNLTYTLEGVSEDLVWLDVNGDVSGSSNNENVEMNLKGTQTGTIETILNSGMISSGDLKMEIEATIKSLDIEIPMKLTSETKISGTKL